MTLRCLCVPVLLLALSPVAASAQTSGPPVVSGVVTADPGTYGPEMRETRRTIDQGRDSGQLSKRQARALRKEANQTDVLAQRYSSDGLTPSEARELDMRARALDSLAGAARSRSAGN